MWRYKLLLFIIFPPVVLYTLWQGVRAFEIRYIIQRLSIFFSGKIKPKGLWIHAASVGEVNAVIPFILKIHKEKPELAITITSNTISSSSVIKKHLSGNIKHYYFPLDYQWAIKRLINKIKPQTIFIVETEFWPNFYTQAHIKNIPLIIINGRISEKTLHARMWLKKIYAQILPLVTQVYARSNTDQSRFLELGANPNNMEVLGNIKFAMNPVTEITPINLNRDYVLAASTREEEEQLIVETWLKSDKGSHLLVIVPRHPKRLTEILKQLKPFDCNVAVRSKGQPINKNTEVYIADTIGELRQFIAGSEFVLMGGSFVEKGGHNILEVAQMGKVVIFGQNMNNFRDEAKIFVEKDIGIQCHLDDLLGTLNAVITDSRYRKSFEKNTHDFIGSNVNIIDKFYKKLKPYIND